MLKDAKIYLAGHEGMVGSALLDLLRERGYEHIVTRPFQELDLRDQKKVREHMEAEKPHYVFLIAGKVGGIKANIRFPGEYLYDNLMIAANVMEASRIHGVKKLIFLGSSCIYPRESPQPMKEEYLLTGPLEPTNEGYALGKIAGLKLCQYYRAQYGCNFLAAIPPNLYGPRDNFSDDNSHVISALIKKIHHAKTQHLKDVPMWGTGTARREFMFTEDLADGLIFLMEDRHEIPYLNIGSGSDVSIRELAGMIGTIVGYDGNFSWDAGQPDGMPRKLMDSSKINALGWHQKTSLYEGLKRTYAWYAGHLGERTS